MGPWVPNSCSAPSRLSVPAEGTGTSLAGIYPLTQGSEEQERVQQPETGSAAGRKSSWSSSAGQGRAGQGTHHCPSGLGGCPGQVAEPNQIRTGHSQTPAKASPGAVVVEVAKQDFGSWDGEGSSIWKELGRRGCQLSPRVPGHPPWVSQQQGQGVLCPGVFCTWGCPQNSTLLSLQSRRPKARPHPVVAQCPHQRPQAVLPSAGGWQMGTSLLLPTPALGFPAGEETPIRASPVQLLSPGGLPAALPAWGHHRGPGLP